MVLGEREEEKEEGEKRHEQLVLGVGVVEGEL